MYLTQCIYAIVKYNLAPHFQSCRTFFVIPGKTYKTVMTTCKILWDIAKRQLKGLGWNCVTYTRIGIFSDPYFTVKRQDLWFYDPVLIREKRKKRENLHSGIFYAAKVFLVMEINYWVIKNSRLRKYCII